MIHTKAVKSHGDDQHKRFYSHLEIKLREGNGTPLQYSFLENLMDGGAQQAAVHGVAKSQTRLSNFTFMHWKRKWQPTPVFLPKESQGLGSLVGCRLLRLTESDPTEVTQLQQQQNSRNAYGEVSYFKKNLYIKGCSL